MHVSKVQSIQLCPQNVALVAQCLNVDVSSFGSTREEALANLKEAVELYFEGESSDAFTPVTDLSVGQELVNA